MFTLCAFIVLIAIVGAQNPNDAFAQITNFQNSPNEGDGAYHWEFETNNGIAQQESGIGGQSVQGSASWVTPEGELVQFSYIADEFGYRPTGSHIPTPPPIPEAIQRAIEFIRAHPSEDSQPDFQSGFQPEFQPETFNPNFRGDFQPQFRPQQQRFF